MHCPDCHKFVSYEEQEPEVELDIGDDGVVRGTVRIVNACQDCSMELTETTFEIDQEIEIKHHEGKDHELSVDYSADRGSKSGYYMKGNFIPKGGRYGKTFYTVSVDMTVTCSCGKLEVQESWEDEIQASGMDSLV